MKRFLLLCAFVVSLFLTMIVSAVAAVESVSPLTQPKFRWQAWTGAMSAFSYDSAGAACAGWASVYPQYATRPAPLPGCFYDIGAGSTMLLGDSGSDGVAATCPSPASGAAYTFNSISALCERPLALECSAPQVLNTVGDACITPTNPQSCNSSSVYNPSTGMCQEMQGGCVTVTLMDGRTATTCDVAPPLVCPPGKTPGTANGVMMCAGGSPLPTPRAPGVYTGSSVSSGSTVNNYTTNNTTTNTATGSESVSTTTGSTSVNVDMAPVVASANQTTLAVNAGSITKFCQDNPRAAMCLSTSADGSVSAAQSSTFYTAGSVSSGQTFGGAISSFSNRVLSSGVGSAMTSFFIVSSPGGACPVWSASVPGMAPLVFDFFCTSTFTALLPWMRGVILLIFSVVAFRIAVL